jgi:hypothetical protein
MMTRLLRSFGLAPRPVLMAIPIIGVLIVSGGLFLLALEGGQAAERQLAHRSAPNSVPTAQQEATALTQVHSAPRSYTSQP